MGLKLMAALALGAFAATSAVQDEELTAESIRAAISAAVESPEWDGAGRGWPFDQAASWRVASILPDEDPFKPLAYKVAITGPEKLEDEQRDEAWAYGVRCATETMALDQAYPVQLALHERYAATWSALNLAGTSHRKGLVEEADEILRAQIERARAAGDTTGILDLTNHRGIYALGRGDRRRARDHFGRAVAGGWRDSALILAREDLAAGRLDAARAGFRALLVEEQPHAWAQRGWGLTLLP